MRLRPPAVEEVAGPPVGAAVVVGPPVEAAVVGPPVEAAYLAAAVEVALSEAVVTHPCHSCSRHRPHHRRQQARKRKALPSTLS